LIISETAFGLAGRPIVPARPPTVLDNAGVTIPIAGIILTVHRSWKWNPTKRRLEPITPDETTTPVYWTPVIVKAKGKLGKVVT
jgi:hypothetical protein